MPPDQHRRLTEWICSQLPEASDIVVSEMGPPSSGGSNVTALFDLHYRNPEPVTEKLVLRTIAPGRGLFPDYDLALQAGVMRALEPTPVPAATVRWFEKDAAILDSPFIIMERIEGETPTDSAPGFHGRGLFFEATEAERVDMWWAAMDQIIALQRLDWRTLDLPALVGMASTADEAMQQHVRLFEQYLDWTRLEPVPTIERGLRWLRAAHAPDDALVLTWGDARPGNIFYHHKQVAGLLDWELAAIGVAEADIAYLIWSAAVLAETNGTPRLPGLPTREQSWERYARLSGRGTDAIRFGEMFTLLRLSVMAVLGVAAKGLTATEYLNSNVTVTKLAEMLDEEDA